MSNHLQGGTVDISLIQTAARNNLINLLEKCPGTKAIVWDNSLAGPTGLVFQYPILKEHDVVKMYPLRNVPFPETAVKHILFITRPKLELMDLVAQNVHSDSNSRATVKKQYHLFFVSRKSWLCIQKLQESGMFGSLTLIEELKCDFFTFDSDLISMEIPDVYKEYYLENDPTCLYQVAQAIVFLQKIYGPIPKFWGKGVMAQQVWTLVNRLQKENNNNFINDQRTSPISQIILIDRSVDLISPLVTQLTYEGLIDEIYGINNGSVHIAADRFLSNEERNTKSLTEDKKQIILNSGDKLFSEIRDKNFNAVGAYLSKQAKIISSQMEDRRDKTVQEMKLFVQRLPQILASKEALAKHTAIAECVKEVTDSFEFLDNLQVEQEFLNCIDTDKVSPYIEDLIAQQQPLVKVLRLICLQCVANSGLKSKVLDYYKKEIVQVYGVKSLLALINLEKAGILKVQSGTRQYAVLRKALRLTMEDTSEINPTDISYVHSVYAPLSVRIAEQMTKVGGWKQLQDVLGLLPGPVFDENLAIAADPSVENGNESHSVVLVFFVGGCTFAEISALRFLSQQEDSNVEFVIATTKLINGNTFLKSIMEV
ncbi:vacuolar protein sorting-associated protein 33A [Agrilus planipennis]|uniref:Vacuolar protein sorting-associated protein 33A n=1 Tax=Agrilus planipennis TaxID=224129 RepID=A0A1W4XPN8_AGRPL|nr:vacuolar protein sorting-associated protein 33A [Agrilus planipennis]